VTECFLTAIADI